MDSLTQIVLGAAVGEVVLGKKIGNRAMLWGAIAGTIPDLDVIIGSVFMNEINGLAFHRAITHSIFFAIFFSFLLAFYTQWLYSRGHHKHQWYKILATGATMLFLMLVAGVFTLISSTLGGTIGMVFGSLVSLAAFGYFGYRMINHYLKKEQEVIEIGWKQWYLLFFWAIFTHPLLDCLTVYGTQLFAPFTNYRVALNTISVADPLYTLPFIVCLIFASFQARSFFEKRRRKKYVVSNEDSAGKQVYSKRNYLNWAGIIISSLYLVWTVYNKSKVNQVLEDTLAAENISYSRYMTGPTILNNVLWSATAETENSFYTGLYSFYDKEKSFKLMEVPKQHNLLLEKEDDHVINTLRWFSKDYYAVMRRKDGRLQLNDMRYGTFRGAINDENGYIFKFVVEKDENGYYQLDAAEGGPPRGGEDQMMQDLWNRIKGE